VECCTKIPTEIRKWWLLLQQTASLIAIFGL